MVIIMSFKYIVQKLDGDYAHLKRSDIESDEDFLVARALLPDGIEEGTMLLFENFEYCIIEE